MKRLIAWFFSSIFVLNVFSQGFCKTPAITDTENVRRLSSHGNRSVNTSYLLKVYFHVIRNSFGMGGISTSGVSNAYNILNSDFNSRGIYFYWDESIDFIDNNTCYNNSPNSNIFYVNNHTDGIDIYLYPSYSGNYAGLANGVGVSSEFYLYGNYDGTPLCNTHIISHEMGHVLNLWHTHHGTYTEGTPMTLGYDGNQCKELVNGANSSSCGDYIEDTPADPNLMGKVNAGCIYTGIEKDANNQSYNPDVNLIMSYAPPSCMNYFTTKQGLRMKESIANLPFLIQTQYPFSISGPEHPCGTTTYSVANLPTGYTADWSIAPAVNFLNSSILTTNSPQQNQCTITNTIVFPWSTTLYCDVKNAAGATVATLSKPIRNTFDLTFSQSGFGSYPSIPASTVVSDGTIVVNHKCWVTLSSEYFDGMTILHTGASPQ
ncbi:MAG: hypothetical protein AUK63_2423, partial [bacterium P3]